MTVTFRPIQQLVDGLGNPVGAKLADVTLHFEDGPLAGMALDGFVLWWHPGRGFTVSMPASTYSVLGQRRHRQLLRPSAAPEAEAAVRALILDAWAAYQMRQVDGDRP